MIEQFLLQKDNTPFPIVKNFITSGIVNNKYDGDMRNDSESKKRLALIPQLEIYSNSICDDLEIERVKLSATGSALAGYANENSDLDVVIHANSNHPLVTNSEIRKDYSAKMRLLVKATKKASFAVNFIIKINI